MFDSAKRAFAAFKSAPKIVNSEEAAWSESSMYRGADFPKFNPDSLIGRKGYAVYPKMMTDEQIKAVVRFKRDAITSRQIIFECEHETLSETDNLFRKELSEHIIDQANGSFSDALNGIMSSMYNGFSLTEKIYQHIEYKDRTWVGIDRLEVKPCDTFYFHVDQYGTVERLTQKFDGKEQELDLAKFIHFVQNPDVDKHYGRSELRECYRAWFSKDMTIKFQNIHLERFAAGFIWAAPKDGKTLLVGSPEYTALQSVMSNLQATSAIILPSGIELHVEHPATTDMFERAIAQHDKAIAKALLVPNLLGITEQGTTGSYAQSETQLEAFFWTLEADSKRLEDTINEQLFWELGEQNFGDGYYPRLKFKPLSERRKMEIVKTWTSLVTGKAVEATDTDEKYLREILDFPEKGEPITKPAPVTDPNAPQNNEQPEIDPETGKPKDAPKGEKPPVAKPEAKPIEETIVGKQGITVSAFSRAMKRVDFAVIANKADNSTKDIAYEVAAINSQCVARLVALAEELKLGTAEGHPNDLQKIQYTASEMSQLKAALTKGLKDAWAIGESHAKREVQKAQYSRNFGVDDQPRDDDGRWSNGGGNGGGNGDAEGDKSLVAHSADLNAISKKIAERKVTFEEGVDINKQVSEALGRENVFNLNSRGFPAGGEDMTSLVSRVIGSIGNMFENAAKKTDLSPEKVAKAKAQAENVKSVINKVLGFSKESSQSFKINDLALQDLAASYLKQKGYTLAGDISAATQKTIRNILMEGVKVSKSAAETKRAIYKALEADGMLTEEAVVEALGAKTVKNASARIDTAIRTTSFEAINEARYSFFSDPALNGFVEALEYSAILDDRTTEICSQLNGETYGIDSEVWSTFRPPNHFNAIASGTQIITSKGCKRIEDVEIGDSVLTHRGNWKRIYSVMVKTPDLSVIKVVTLNSGMVFLATDEHPVLTENGWNAVMDLKIGDVLFQHHEDITRTKDGFVLHPENCPPLFDKESVSYEVGFCSDTAGMSFAVDLKDDHVFDKREIGHIAFDRMLAFKRHAAQAESFKHDVLMPSQSITPSTSFADSSFLDNTCHAHRVAGSHSFRVKLMNGTSLLSETESPMVGSTQLSGWVSIRNSALVNSVTHDNAVPFAPVIESGFAETETTLNGADRFLVPKVAFGNENLDCDLISEVYHNENSGWLGSAIISIVEIEYNYPVWNLGVEDDESYHANGIIVHNCRSLLIPVTINDTWVNGDDPTAMPQKGFGFARPVCQHKAFDRDADIQSMLDGQQGIADAITALANKPAQPIDIKMGDVNVHLPDGLVNLEATIAQPAVTVNTPAPNVVVNVAPSEAAIINNVHPATVELTLPDRKSVTTVSRDGQGNLVSATQIETSKG